jgi:hypothetical protein
MTETWPVAELDPVRRLRVLARSLPGTSYDEILLDVPFERVWATAADLERQMPLLITDIRRFTVTGVAGERLEAHARSPLGLRARFDVVLRPGWCFMQSRFLIGGLAATPEGEGATRFAFCGGLRVPGLRRLDVLLHPLLRHGPVERFAAQFRS